MKKIIVTGATGFIGRQTIPILKEYGYEIHALSRKMPNNPGNEPNWHSIDIFDYSRVRKFCSSVKADILLHLGWYGGSNARMTSTQNMAWVEASLHLARNFTESGGSKIVLGSSCAEYDWQYGYCHEEITPISPHSLYGECKASLNKIFKKYCRHMDIRYSCGRIFFVYGPYESDKRLVPYVINALLQNKQAFISNDSLRRDYMHTGDVADALVTLLESNVEGAINIGTGRPTRLQRIVNMIGQKLDRAELVTYGAEKEQKNEYPVVFADISRLRDELGWEPRLDLETGIASTIDWWRTKISEVSR